MVLGKAVHVLGAVWREESIKTCVCPGLEFERFCRILCKLLPSSYRSLDSPPYLFPKPYPVGISSRPLALLPSRPLALLPSPPCHLSVTKIPPTRLMPILASASHPTPMWVLEALLRTGEFFFLHLADSRLVALKGLPSSCRHSARVPLKFLNSMRCSFQTMMPI